MEDAARMDRDDYSKQSNLNNNIANSDSMKDTSNDVQNTSNDVNMDDLYEKLNSSSPPSVHND